MQLNVEAIYRRHCLLNTAITPHLPRLRDLATGYPLAVEFGVKRGASSAALLMGAAHVISYDVKATPEARELERAAGDAWEYRLGDSRTADVPACDLMFIDSQHDFETCDAELQAHAGKVRHVLVFHDVGTFGEIGANGETGEHKWQYRRGLSCPADSLGIRPAIDNLMIRDPSWLIAARYVDSHGLLVLRRAF